MNSRRIGILIGLFSFTAHGYVKDDLTSLTQTLEALSKVLHKEKRGSSLSAETMASLRDFAQQHGIDDLNEALTLALSNVGKSEGPQPTGSPAGPVLPPPPPPPPAVIKVPVSTNAPAETILTMQRALKKTGELISEQEKQSDEEFLAAFRDAQDIDEIIDTLNALKDDPLYLRKEALQEKKTPLPTAASSGGLQLTKIIITRLLRRKNQLIFNFFNRDYLKDYMYDPDLFTQEDFDRLRDLIANEGKKASPIINKNLTSDMLFLNAFRGATSIDAIIQNLKALESNPRYLKPEIFKAPLKLPINDLLKKKSPLVLEAMQPESHYLKDYLFDTSLFTQEDYEALKKLFM